MLTTYEKATSSLAPERLNILNLCTCLISPPSPRATCSASKFGTVTRTAPHNIDRTPKTSTTIHQPRTPQGARLNGIYPFPCGAICKNHMQTICKPYLHVPPYAHHPRCILSTTHIIHDAHSVRKSADPGLVSALLVRAMVLCVDPAG